MPNEGFFQRWSRLKNEEAAATPPEVAPPQAAALPAEAAPAGQAPLPTLDDVAALGADADYGRFVAPGVDTGVRRLALKKMFADPHFNLIDGLDIYMADYNKPSPVSPAMLASLHHAQGFLARALADEEERQRAAAAGPAAVASPAAPAAAVDTLTAPAAAAATVATPLAQAPASAAPLNQDLA